MSLFTARKPEKRVISYQSVWGSGGDWSQSSGSVDDQESAMRLSAVFDCVRILSDGVASLPLDGYRAGSGPGLLARIPTPPLFLAPSTLVRRYDWIVQLVASLALHGNAYGLVTATKNGWPSSIEWLNPTRVDVEQVGFHLVYRLDGVALDDGSIFHVRGLVLPGEVKGVSVLAAAKRSFEAGLGAERFGSDFFDKDGVPSGILTTDKSLNDPDGTKSQTTKERFKAAARGRDVVVLGDGTKFDAISVNPDESQFLDSQRFSLTQIARFFGVPPEMIGGTSGSSMTYANVEQRMIDFVTNSLRPWFTRIEQAFSDLIPPNELVRFNADATIRTDLLNRYEAHAIGIKHHFLTPNEAREKEDLAPIDGGNEFPKLPADKNHKI